MIYLLEINETFTSFDQVGLNILLSWLDYSWCFPEAKMNSEYVSVILPGLQQFTKIDFLIYFPLYLLSNHFYNIFSFQKYNKKFDIKNSCENLNSQKVFFLICRNLLNPFRLEIINSFFNPKINIHHNHWFSIFIFSKLECPSSVLRMLKYSLSVWVMEFDEG